MVDISKVLKRKMELKVLEKKLSVVSKRLSSDKNNKGLQRLAKKLKGKIRGSKSVISRGKKGRQRR